MVDKTHGRGSNRCLNLVTPALAVLAVICLVVALITPNWLYTDEKMKNRNRSIVFGPNMEPEYLSKLTSSGLWVLCETQLGSTNFTCIPINYFPQDKYRPDDQDSTNAIPYTARKSSAYFLFSFILMLNGEFFCFTGFLKTSKKIFSFISGVCFIIAGLVILTGIINYISIFKAEVGNKLYARSMLALPVFSYSYGYSFIIILMSFLLSEISGICAIFQFIYHHQQKWDEIEMNNCVEKPPTLNSPMKDNIKSEVFAQSQCPLHSGLTNGNVIKSNDLDNTSLHDVKSEKCHELQPISTKGDYNHQKPKYESETMANIPVKMNGCVCVPHPLMCHHNQPLKYINSENNFSLSEYINSSEDYTGNQSLSYTTPMSGSLPCCQVVFVPRQGTLSSIGTETTGYSTPLCSPNYPGRIWEASSAGHNSISLDSLQISQRNAAFATNQNTAEPSATEEKRNRMTRHISIDDQPITHTYHQDSYEDSSDVPASSSEESSGSHHSNDSAGGKTSLSSRCTNGSVPALSDKTSRNGYKIQPSVVIPPQTNGKLKSSLSKSSLIKQQNFNFGDHQNIQQIVKQKRENCLQNGLEMTAVKNNCVDDVFEEECEISQV